MSSSAQDIFCTGLDGVNHGLFMPEICRSYEIEPQELPAHILQRDSMGYDDRWATKPLKEAVQSVGESLKRFAIFRIYGKMKIRGM